MMWRPDRTLTRYVIAAALALVAAPGLAQAGPILNPENGHYYGLINAPVTWADANAAASAVTHLGVSGHLVTVTSASENLFLTDTFGASALHFHWLGGFQPPGSPEPAGGWSWVTGEAFGYANWWPGGEPNNSGGIENRIVFDHGVTTSGKSWNDLSPTAVTAGYVVEFDVPPASTVPEPSTLSLLLAGAGVAVGYAGVRRRAASGGA